MCRTACSWVQVRPEVSSAWQEFALRHAGGTAASSCCKHACSVTGRIIAATSAGMVRQQVQQQGKAFFIVLQPPRVGSHSQLLLALLPEV